MEKMVLETVEISKREHDFMKDDMGRLASYGTYIAINAGYHPSGYGLASPKIYQDNGKYYFEWLRERSCD